MNLPKNLFRVTINGAKSMRYAEKGGGTFFTLKTAEDRASRLRRDHPEAEVHIFITECSWVDVADMP